MAYPVKFKVESTRVAHSFSFVVASPQCTCCAAAIDTDQTISTTDARRLQHMHIHYSPATRGNLYTGSTQT